MLNCGSKLAYIGTILRDEGKHTTPQDINWRNAIVIFSDLNYTIDVIVIFLYQSGILFLTLRVES